MLNQSICMLAKLIQPRKTRCYSKDATSSTFLNVAHRLPPPCSCPPYADPVKKPCFDINKVIVERANRSTVGLIKSFLYENYFMSEPSISGLFLPLDSPYLAYLAEHYSSCGDRWLAFEVGERTYEKKLIGVMVGNKKHPWEPDIYEDWAEHCHQPERSLLFLHAHCYRSPNLFKKYKVPFIYNIDVVVTAERVRGQGVGDLLLRTALLYALEMRFPLIQVIATNSHLNNPCKRANMTLEWSMKYREFIDYCGRSVLIPRQPHNAVNIYIRRLHPTECAVPDQLYTPSLYNLFKSQCKDKECKNLTGIQVFTPLPKCPTVKSC